MKKRREEAAAASAAGDGEPTAAAGSPAAAADAPKKQDAAELDDYINSLLGSAASPAAPAAAAVSDAAAEAEAEVAAADAKAALLAKRRAALSVVSHLGEMTLAPVRAETYEVGTQMPDELDGAGVDDDSAVVTVAAVIAGVDAASGSDEEDDEEDSDGGEDELSGGAEEESAVKELSAEEKRDIIASEDFHAFLDSSSRLIERALGQSQLFDIMVQYGGRAEEVFAEESKREQISHAVDFYDERLCRGRAVTSISVSAKYSELVVASYSNRLTDEWASRSDMDGLVIMWSTILQSRPENYFQCQSHVLSAQVHPWQSHLLIGTTYTGQVVLWDMRESRRTPTYRTPLAATGHTHPVFSLEVVGAKGNYLLTASTNGRLCQWDLNNLSSPMMTLDVGGDHERDKRLPEESARDLRDVAITSMTLKDATHPNVVVVGCESGAVFDVQLHGSHKGVTRIVRVLFSCCCCCCCLRRC
eukprot:PLAT2472.1.p1 GENE.PLAT2472.1~~PLAT2472.1.p1  ORF type:complete len:498 (-),score=157.28 PLAT2472.1:615-2036(-)